MKNLQYTLLISILLSVGFIGNAQNKEIEPIIKDFGPVFEIKEMDFQVDTTLEYKAVFDIMNSPDENDKRNTWIETAARFLNMHVKNGVPAKQVKAVLVVHNKASKDLIMSEAYKKRYGTDNPNEKMIKALLDADVQIIFCGQSSMARGFPKSELIPGVQLGLSAMTALIHFQNKDYQLIKF